MRTLELLAAWACLAVAACAAAVADDDPPPAPPPSDAAPAQIAYVGRVVDEGGRPVAGARLWADNGGSYQVMKTETEPAWRALVPDPDRAADVGPWTVRGAEPSGADGRFRVDGVQPPVGQGWVVAVHAEHVVARRSAKGIAAHGGVVDVGDVVLLAGRTVRVAVTRTDGAPAAGAWVVARPAEHADGMGTWWSDDTPGETRAARAGPDGVATVRGLRGLRYRVAAFTADTPATVGEVRPEAGRVVEIALALRPGGTLRVVVASRGDGAPIAGARVVVDRADDGAGWSFPAPPPLARMTTDASGVATAAGLPDDAPELDVRVVPPDWASDGVHHPGAFSVGARTKPGETVRVLLDAPLEIRVPVSDARTGEPVAGAKAIARAVWDRYDRTGGDPVDLTGTSAEGSVAFPAIRAGPWTFDVWAADHLPVRIGPVDVRGGVAVPAARLEPATGLAEGRVVERSSGRPVVGATLASYEWISQFLDGQRRAATSGDDGSFRLDRLLGAGFPLRVEVRAPGYVDEVVTWEGAERRADLGDVRLLRAATIHGRLTDLEGRPLAQEEVRLVRAGLESRGKGEGWSATTDAGGRFVFGGLRPGAYVVVGQRQDADIRVAEGQTVERDVAR